MMKQQFVEVLDPQRNAWHDKILDKLSHINLVCMSMAASACDVPAEIVPLVHNYTWDYDTEDDRLLEGVKWSNRSVRYTSRDNDILLPRDVLLDLARHTCSDSRIAYYRKLNADYVAGEFTNDIVQAHERVFNDEAGIVSMLNLYLSVSLAIIWPVIFVMWSSVMLALTKAEAPFSIKRQDLALVKQVCECVQCDHC